MANVYTTNLTHLLNSKKYKKFLEGAERERYFNNGPIGGRIGLRYATPELHIVKKSSPKRNVKQFVPKLTPGKRGLMIGNTRVNLFSGSPPVKKRARTNNNSNNNTKRQKAARAAKRRAEYNTRKNKPRLKTPTSPLNLNNKSPKAKNTKRTLSNLFNKMNIKK